jgi:hypothetical protein
MFTKNIGFTPNMMAAFALSPITFNSWATLLGSLLKALDVKMRDSIDLAMVRTAENLRYRRASGDPAAKNPVPPRGVA